MSTPSSGHGGWPSTPPPHGAYQSQPVVQQVFYSPGGPATAPVGTLPGDKSGGVAGLLSFLFPGIGQMYTGDVGRGVVWFLCAVVGYPIGILLILISFGILAIIILPAMLAFEIFAIVDAVHCAQRHNIRSRMAPPAAAYGGVSPQLPAPQLPAPPSAAPRPYQAEQKPYSGGQPYLPPRPPSPTDPAGGFPAPKYPAAPPTLALPAPSPESKPSGQEDDFAVSLRPRSGPPAFCTECGHALSPTETGCPACGATP